MRYALHARARKLERDVGARALDDHLLQAAAMRGERAFRVVGLMLDGGHTVDRGQEFLGLGMARGTADLRNWLTDLDCKLVPVLNFRVHRGFYEAMQAVEADLDASLGQAQEMRLWVTGHSLGGALAKLWALWAAGRGHDVAGVYTFGQPRVGDASFVSFYDSVLRARSFRVVHADDIVPRVPWMLSRYRHAGHEVFFNGQSKMDHYPLIDPPWPAKLLYGLPALARGLAHGKLAFLDDHHISHYLDLFPARREEAIVSPSLNY